MSFQVAYRDQFYFGTPCATFALKQMFKNEPPRPDHAVFLNQSPGHDPIFPSSAYCVAFRHGAYWFL